MSTRRASSRRPARSIARQHTQQVVLGQAGELARVQQVGELLGDRIQPGAGGDGGGVVHAPILPDRTDIVRSYLRLVDNYFGTGVGRRRG